MAREKKAGFWQITYKVRRGAPMKVYEACTLLQVLIWVIKNLSGCKIAVIVRIEEND